MVVWLRELLNTPRVLMFRAKMPSCSKVNVFFFLLKKSLRICLLACSVTSEAIALLHISHRRFLFDFCKPEFQIIRTQLIMPNKLLTAHDNP